MLQHLHLWRQFSVGNGGETGVFTDRSTLLPNSFRTEVWKQELLIRFCHMT